MVRGEVRDAQISTRDGQSLQRTIEGVSAHAGLSVPYDRGVLTEMYRPDWDPSGSPVSHVHQVRMFPGIISAWHVHHRTTDRLYVNLGHMRVVLFDSRPGSPTRGTVNEFFVGEARSSLVVVPAGVWHGLQNLGGSDCLYLNFASEPYNYEEPDHSRLPWDSPEIPYRWTGGEMTTGRLGSR